MKILTQWPASLSIAYARVSGRKTALTETTVSGKTSKMNDEKLTTTSSFLGLGCFFISD